MPNRISTWLMTALASELILMAALFTVVLDQYAHKRVEQLGGVNTWGYRGPVMKQRLPHEFRIAVVGGDAAFGWGVAPAETTADYLRTEVQGMLAGSGESIHVTAVNLGALGMPARGYSSRLAQFEYLAPDVICLYLDLADTRTGSVVPSRNSAVTALTGYVPMLPLVLTEKGLPLAAVGSALAFIDRRLHALLAPVETAPEPREISIGRAVHTALGLAPVVVVLPAPTTPASRIEHARLLQTLSERAQTSPRLAK